MNSVKPDLLNVNSQNQLNGVYENRPIGFEKNTEGEELKKLLFKPFYEYEWEEERDFKGQIEIEFLSTQKVKIVYSHNDEVLEVNTLSGKFKNGFFLIRRKIKPIGLPFIFYTYKERRIMFGINEQDELIVKTGIYDFGNIFIFTGGEFNVFKYKFKKKKTSR